MPCDAMQVAKYRLAKAKQEIEVYVHSDHDTPGRYEYGIKGPEVREGIKGGVFGLEDAVKKAVKIAIASHTEMLQAKKNPGDIAWGTVTFADGTVIVESNENGDVRIYSATVEGPRATRPPDAAPAKAASMAELAKGLRVEPVAVAAAPSRWRVK